MPLLLATLLALLALAVRAAWAAPWTWLAWNLVLAWVPVVLGRVAVGHRSLLLLVGPLWLLFLPNAPYLLTDVIHLKARAAVPLWFDAALLGGCGALGLALGAHSLATVARAVERELGRPAGWLLWLATPPLCGYAIWLGRFERWNSWDLILRPSAVLGEVIPTFLDPLGHPRTWAVTVTFAAVVLAANAVSESSLRPRRSPAPATPRR